MTYIAVDFSTLGDRAKQMISELQGEGCRVDLESQNGHHRLRIWDDRPIFTNSRSKRPNVYRRKPDQVTTCTAGPDNAVFQGYAKWQSAQVQP